MDPLIWAGRHAKWVLVFGLASAILLPSVAEFLSGYLTPLICMIMFLGALRLRSDQFAMLWDRPRETFAHVMLLQVALPCFFLLMFWLTGTHSTVLAQVTVLLLAAPVIVSSPNMAAIMKLDVAASMRLLVWSTVLLPLTSLPFLTFLFGGHSIADVIASELRLIAIIVVAGGLGITMRFVVFKNATVQTEARLDGLSALALAIFVLALMPAIATQLSSGAWQFATLLSFAFAVNFGFQFLAFWILKQTQHSKVSGAYALAYGNRNLALFFAALTTEQTSQFLAFLAVYQIPMYLTPVLLNALYHPKN